MTELLIGTEIYVRADGSFNGKPKASACRDRWVAYTDADAFGLPLNDCAKPDLRASGSDFCGHGAGGVEGSVG